MSDIEPRLVAVRGPLKGSILVLPDGDYTVGRQGSNNLYLETTPFHASMHHQGPAAFVR